MWTLRLLLLLERNLHRAHFVSYRLQFTDSVESCFEGVSHCTVVRSGVSVGVITGAVMTGVEVTVADTESVAGEQDKSGGSTAALDAW